MKNMQKIFMRMQELNEYNSRVDYHMHSSWTDGNNTINEMANQAIENGLVQFAITDHIRTTSNYYPQYKQEIEKISKLVNKKILVGFEAKICNTSGKIDIPDEAVAQADFVIASVHRIPIKNGFCHAKELTYEELSKIERELSIAAINNSNRHFSVLGHCGGMSIATYGYFPEEYFEDIIMECKYNDVAFEFNYKYHHNYEHFIKKALKKHNTYVSIGSDAHKAESIANRSFINNLKL